MPDSNSSHNPLGSLPINTLLPKFAIPSIVAYLVTSLYNIVDQIFIGQGVGYLGNAATNVAFPFTTVSTAHCPDDGHRHCCQLQPEFRGRK